jgi:hypothetical protein
MTSSLVRHSCVSVGCLAALGLGPVPLDRAPAGLALDLTTLHAAALSSARSPADSSDGPYLLVSIVASSGRAETRELPATGHWTLRLDQAIGDMPISTLALAPGDSAQVLLTVLEDRSPSRQELEVATATTARMKDHRTVSRAPAAGAVAPALAPLTSRGGHWLGSAALLLTNVGGSTTWQRLDCVATCNVVRSPVAAGASGAALSASAAQPVTGVVELSGASAKYHLQVAVRRVS